MSKTPGGQAASDKHLKQQAQTKGLGADNAPGRTEGGVPGDAPVASDSYNSTVGVDDSANNPGEKGNVGAKVGEMTESQQGDGRMK